MRDHVGYVGVGFARAMIVASPGELVWLALAQCIWHTARLIPWVERVLYVWDGGHMHAPVVAPYGAVYDG